MRLSSLLRVLEPGDGFRRLVSAGGKRRTLSAGRALLDAAGVRDIQGRRTGWLLDAVLA